MFLIVIGWTLINVSSRFVETLQETLHRFPQLMTCVCHVDVYEPWSHQTLTTIADNWLRDPQLKVGC